ncbi:MAG TPA: polymer-forming cytoskeletal protein [Saprospiraceae bacterium]|nr:polymer-forming cytoskeletal protein [Saprospiraceae bacterium]
MFNKKKKETPSKSSLMPSTTSHSLNSLVSGTFVEGTINSDSDIRIDGTIKGNLNCKAKVIIGPNGTIEGSVKCSNAVIEGKFSGNISVTNLLHIKESAQIDGDVITGKLIVQEGAAFNVTCKMSGPSSNGILKPNKQSNSIVQQAAKAGSI